MNGFAIFLVVIGSLFFLYELVSLIITIVHKVKEKKSSDLPKEDTPEEETKKEDKR